MRSNTLQDLFLPIEWLSAGKVRFLDQTLLPQEETWVETADYRVVAEAIRRLQVRGAPLIGISAAYGLALAALESAATDAETLRRDVTEAATLPDGRVAHGTADDYQGTVRRSDFGLAALAELLSIDGDAEGERRRTGENEGCNNRVSLHRESLRRDLRCDPSRHAG